MVPGQEHVRTNWSMKVRGPAKLLLVYHVWSPGRMKSREHLWHVLCENRGDRKCMTSTRSKETSKTTIFLAIFCKFWSIEILLLKLLMMYLPMRQYQISNTTQYSETSAECKGNLEIIKSR